MPKAYAMVFRNSLNLEDFAELARKYYPSTYHTLMDSSNYTFITRACFTKTFGMEEVDALHIVNWTMDEKVYQVYAFIDCGEVKYCYGQKDTSLSYTEGPYPPATGKYKVDIMSIFEHLADRALKEWTMHAAFQHIYYFTRRLELAVGFIFLHTGRASQVYDKFGTTAAQAVIMCGILSKNWKIKEGEEQGMVNVNNYRSTTSIAQTPSARSSLHMTQHDSNPEAEGARTSTKRSAADTDNNSLHPKRSRFASHFALADRPRTNTTQSEAELGQLLDAAHTIKRTATVFTTEIISENERLQQELKAMQAELMQEKAKRELAEEKLDSKNLCLEQMFAHLSEQVTK